IDVLAPVSKVTELPRVRLFGEVPTMVKTPALPLTVTPPMVIGWVKVTVKFPSTPKFAKPPWVQAEFTPESTVAVQFGLVVSQFPDTLVPSVAPSGSQKSDWAQIEPGNDHKSSAVKMAKIGAFIYFGFAINGLAPCCLSVKQLY